MNEIECYILAAGMGTRMNSSLPKVLHKICGTEMVNMVLNATHQTAISNVTVVVPQKSQQYKETIGTSVKYKTQNDRKGTGHALLTAKPDILDSGIVVVLNGDIPLIRKETIDALIDQHKKSQNILTLVTSRLESPKGYGRIIRNDSGKITGITEQNEIQKKSVESINEINAGIYCFDSPWIWNSLEALTPSPRGEYFLTNIVQLAHIQNKKIGSVTVDSEEIKGVNNRIELSEVEQLMRRRIRNTIMLSGVTLTDPDSTFIDQGVTIGADTTILPNTHITQNSNIGSNCQIGPNAVIRESSIGDDCKIHSAVIEQSTIHDNVSVGPFSHIRPGCLIEKEAHIGNYTEVKNCHIGERTKSGHFCYLGDSEIGSDVNIGAGVVTCNYDGISKHNTKIGSGAFIGSDTMLIAPIEIGKRSATGAGSIITKNVPDDSSAIGVPARVRKKRL